MNRQGAEDAKLREPDLEFEASDHSLGLLINFNERLLRQGIRRVIRTH